jgi:hypothetical protein
LHLKALIIRKLLWKHLIKKNSVQEEALLSLNSKGYFVQPDFLSSNQCDELCFIIDTIIKEKPQFIHPAVKNDHRIYGIENLEPRFSFFTENELITEIASSYLGQVSRAAFTLGARLDFCSSENNSSGGGWHRDSPFRQLKAMIYLSDVDNESGPFQYLPKSQMFTNILKANFVSGKEYDDVRWSEESVRHLMKSGWSMETFHAKKGTLFIFDSSGIHRGKPIKNINRYAITNYYYPENKINTSLYEHFSPVAGFSNKSS